MALEDYQTYRSVPELAGLCSMDRAVKSDWSLSESVERLRRIHFTLRRVHEVLTAKITAEPIYELKTAFSLHAYVCAEQVTLIRKRVSEMREPPLGLEKEPCAALARLLEEVDSTPSTLELLIGIYQVVLPGVLRACQRIQDEAHPLADSPTIRIAKLMEFELEELVEFGHKAIDCLREEKSEVDDLSWCSDLRLILGIAGDVDGCDPERKGHDAELPPRRYEENVNQYNSEPRRDERFIDSFNAGVNPEAFLYDDRFAPRDKTLMMYYKRIRELDVPEMMASILVDLREDEPWGFHMEMSRQLWDEARHAMMGEVGFASLGIDWASIPINFTWSRNLNLQLDARERHGVLFFIEQGLMPRSGKRYEWEVANESGDPLAALFQDFDWADEVLHAQIGRRWYVPRYQNLKDALGYGDRCWSKVLSHWRADLESGLTQHQNWWPDLYQKACELWNQEPDPNAMQFSETYEHCRADLEQLD